MGKLTMNKYRRAIKDLQREVRSNDDVFIFINSSDNSNVMDAIRKACAEEMMKDLTWSFDLDKS